MYYFGKSKGNIDMSRIYLAVLECAVHVALPIRLTNWFEPVQKSTPQALRAYCPNMYTLQGPKGVGKQPVGK